MKQKKKSSEITIGLDLGDRRHRLGVFALGRAGLAAFFALLFLVLFLFLSVAA